MGKKQETKRLTVYKRTQMCVDKARDMEALEKCVALILIKKLV